MQITLPLELETLIQQQLDSGKYETAIEVILAGVIRLEQEEDIYQGRLQDLQQDAQIGWEAIQRGELVDGATAMAELRANLRTRYISHLILTEPNQVSPLVFPSIALSPTAVLPPVAANNSSP
jgi:antitoxin ParD1/3/4